MSTPARPADLWGEHHHAAAALRCVDGRHRYYLTRDLDGPGVALHFCMFNPSTATAVADDATCADAWGTCGTSRRCGCGPTTVRP